MPDMIEIGNQYVLSAATQEAFKWNTKTTHQTHIYERNEQNRNSSIQMLRANEKLSGLQSHFKIESFFEKDDKFIAIYESIPSNAISLLDLLKERKGRPLPVALINILSFLLLDHVNSMHQLGIIHRDIKLPNIYVFMNESGAIKIKVKDLRFCQIGSSIADTFFTNHRGSPAYLAPEVTQKNTPYCGIKAEIYSVGVIIYALATGCYPFIASSPKELVEKIRSSPLRLPNNLPELLKYALKNMLNKHPTERKPLKDLLELPWIPLSFYSSSLFDFAPFMQGNVAEEEAEAEESEPSDDENNINQSDKASFQNFSPMDLVLNSLVIPTFMVYGEAY